MPVPVNSLVVSLFAPQTECAEDDPLDIICQARQDLLVIVLSKAIQVAVLRSRCYATSFRFPRLAGIARPQGSRSLFRNLCKLQSGSGYRRPDERADQQNT